MNIEWVKKGFYYAKFYDYCLKIIMNYEDLKDKILEHINVSDKRILDVHCKTGIMTFKIARERPFAHVVGMENNHQFLRLLKRKKRENYVKNIEFMNLSNMDSYEEKFDVITLVFVLNGLPIDEMIGILKKIKSILKVNKKLIIVDCTKAKNIVSQFLINVYQKIFINKKFKTFMTYDVGDCLKDIGFRSITTEEYNGIKMISSINNVV
ncbi:class I SAM-dependent methyltransferase [Mycoplasmatota bacterium]|nr:class I SAM-dependent methyltransferase [Mycoplasmatota bacterium]